MAGSDRPNKSSQNTVVGRTGARFGQVPTNRGRDDEEWGEPAVHTAKEGTGRTGARFGRLMAEPRSAESRPAQQGLAQPGLAQPRPPAMIPRQFSQPVAVTVPEPEPDWVEVDRTRSIVRPYAWTGGRTETAYDLPIEALISTNRATLARMGSRMTHDHRSVADLCLATRSVAEVAALLSLPLGVARVVLGDMAAAGMVIVHRPRRSNGEQPDMAMLERVLIGLRNL